MEAPNVISCRLCALLTVVLLASSCDIHLSKKSYKIVSVDRNVFVGGSTDSLKTSAGVAVSLTRTDDAFASLSFNTRQINVQTSNI